MTHTQSWPTSSRAAGAAAAKVRLVDVFFGLPRVLRSPKGPGSLGDDACQACLADLKRSLISATAASCVVAQFLMGVVANLPLGIAPGMGLNVRLVLEKKRS